MRQELRDAAADLPRQAHEACELRDPVRHLLLEEDFETFLLRELFGTAGHPYRHGGGTGGQRRLVLFGIAALAGWLEVFGGEATLSGLDQRMVAALPAAVARVQQLALVASSAG